MESMESGVGEMLPVDRLAEIRAGEVICAKPVTVRRLGGVTARACNMTGAVPP